MLKDKAKELLGIPLPNNVVASAIGVTESQITQWLSEEGFAKDVQEARSKNLLEATSRDHKYSSIEDRLLEKLEEKLESGLMFTSAREILQAISIINKAVRRGTPGDLAQGQVARTVVSLQLPEGSAFAARFVVNGKNQVMEVAGRSLATMPAKGVVRQLEEMQKNSAQNVAAHKKDVETATEASERLKSLVKVKSFTIAELL